MLAISKFQLRYSSTAGVVTEVGIDINICFSCGGILPGEIIAVELPGFSRQNLLSLSEASFAKPIATEGEHKDIFDSAMWIPEYSSLQFRLVLHQLNKWGSYFTATA